MQINFKTIDIVGRALDQYQESAKNLIAIGGARRKIEQEREDLEFKKKEQSLKLEKMKREGAYSELEHDILSGQVKQYQKQEEDRIKGGIASIKMAEHQNKGVAEQALNFARIGFRNDPQSVLGYLGAMKRNQERTKELRPKMSAGKIGFEEVDVNDGEDVETESDRLSLEDKRLTVQKKKKDLEGGGEGGYSSAEIRAAEKIAEMDRDYESPYELRLQRALPKAREALGGQGSIKKSEVSKGNSRFKKGDVREKNGIQYKRNENGQWLPIS